MVQSPINFGTLQGFLTEFAFELVLYGECSFCLLDAHVHRLTTQVLMPASSHSLFISSVSIMSRSGHSTFTLEQGGVQKDKVDYPKSWRRFSFSCFSSGLSSWRRGGTWSGIHSSSMETPPTTSLYAGHSSLGPEQC
jgi:hypothetical protein